MSKYVGSHILGLKYSYIIRQDQRILRYLNLPQPKKKTLRLRGEDKLFARSRCTVFATGRSWQASAKSEDRRNRP